MKSKTISRRELFKMAVVAAPSMISTVRALVKPQPGEQVSTEEAMTLARYWEDDDLFILQTDYPARGQDVSDLFPIGWPGLASMIEPKRGLFMKIGRKPPASKQGIQGRTLYKGKRFVV